MFFTMATEIEKFVALGKEIGLGLVVNFRKASVNNFSRCLLVQADNIDEVFLQQV